MIPRSKRVKQIKKVAPETPKPSPKPLPDIVSVIRAKKKLTALLANYLEDLPYSVSIDFDKSSWSWYLKILCPREVLLDEYDDFRVVYKQGHIMGKNVRFN